LLLAVAVARIITNILLASHGWVDQCVAFCTLRPRLRFMGRRIDPSSDSLVGVFRVRLRVGGGSSASREPAVLPRRFRALRPACWPFPERSEATRSLTPGRSGECKGRGAPVELARPAKRHCLQCGVALASPSLLGARPQSGKSRIRESAGSCGAEGRRLRVISGKGARKRSAFGGDASARQAQARPRCERRSTCSPWGEAPLTPA
jgi:hypothetical protein